MNTFYFFHLQKLTWASRALFDSFVAWRSAFNVSFSVEIKQTFRSSSYEKQKFDKKLHWQSYRFKEFDWITSFVLSTVDDWPKLWTSSFRNSINNAAALSSSINLLFSISKFIDTTPLSSSTVVMAEDDWLDWRRRKKNHNVRVVW